MKRKLTLLVCVLVVIAMAFTVVSCGKKDNADHTHTYSADWSSDEVGHWHASTCADHEVLKSDYAKHVDADDDAKCDVCENCDHNLESAWSSDAKHHWNASTCAEHKEYKGNLAAHVYEDGSYKCVVCNYCPHPYDEEWTSDAENHWHAPKCNCKGLENKDVAAHTDDDGNAVCDVCEYVICDHVDDIADGLCDKCGYVLCDHSPEEAWTSDAENHWHKATCESHPDYKVALAAHADENGDFFCDTCSYFVGTVADLVGTIDAEAVEKMNTAFIDYYKKTVGNNAEAITDTVMFVEYYDNYAVYKTVDKDTFYCSYYGENDATFVVRIDADGNLIREEYVTNYPVGTTVTLNEIVNASDYEAFVTGLYNLTGKVGMVEGYNAETGAISFSYAYVADSAYVVSVEFTIDAETKGIKSANVTIDAYATSDVTVDTENNTYAVAENASKVQECAYAITQTFGEALDSTEKPNPYSAENSIITDDFTLETRDEEGNVIKVYENEDTLVFEAGAKPMLHFPAELEKLAALSNVELTSTSGLSAYIPYGNPAKPVQLASSTAGEYILTVTVEGTIVYSLKVVVEYKTPTSLQAGVANSELSDPTSADSTTVYVGNNAIIGAIVGENEDPDVTATVISGDATKVTLTESKSNNNWIVTASEAGTYVIELVSTKNTELKDTITVVVEEAPSLADILNGTFTGKTLNYGINITAVFTSTDETNGTVEVTLKGTYSKKIDGVNQTLSADGTATYTYVYNATTGELALTQTEGDDIILDAIMIANYEVVAYINNDMACTLQKQTETGDEGGEQGEATQSPISATMTNDHTYGYNYEFTFVAGESGYYTFTVPAGFGVISKEALSSWGNPYVDFNADGGTFTLELGAGETIDLLFGSLEEKTYELAFTFESNIKQPASGAGTQADPFVITEAGNYVCNYDGTGSWTYFIYYVYTATVDTELTFTFTSDDARYYLVYGNLDAPDQLDTDNSDTVKISVAAGETLAFGIQEYDGAAAQIPFSIELADASTGDEGGEADAGVAGTYVGTGYYPGQTIEVVITDNMVSVDGTETFSYTYVDGVVTLYSPDGSTQINTNMGIWGLTIENDVATSIKYQGYDYTLEKQTASSDDEEPVVTIPTLAEGENTIVIGEDQTADGVDYTLTATVTGTYTVTSNDLLAIFFDSTGIEISRASANLTAGQVVTVKLVSFSGAGTYTATLTVPTEEVEEPTGTEDNPIVWDTLPESVTITSDTNNKVYYQFTATESGVLYITYPSADSWADCYEIVDGVVDGINSQSSSLKEVAKFIVESGKTYRIGLGTYYNAGEFTLALEIGEAVADGSKEFPYPVENGDSYTANFPGGYTGVYYVYEVTENGYVTVTTTYTGNPWLQIGTDASNLTSNMAADGSYLSTMTTYALAGQKVYIAVGDYDYQAAEVPFSVAFEAFESDPYDHIVGTWTGTVTTMWGSNNYTIVVNADGTGTVTEDYGYGTAEYTITLVLVNGTSVTINSADTYGNPCNFELTYDATAGTLANTSASFEKVFALGDNGVNVTGEDMTVVTLTAPANGTYTITVGANCVVCYNGNYYLESDNIFTVNVETGDVISLEVNSLDYTACAVIVNVAFEESAVDEEPASTVLVLGENTVTISAEEAEQGGKEYTFTALVTGQYTFASNDVGVRIFENGTVLGTSIASLEAGKTYTAFVLAMAEGTYTINITAVEQSTGEDSGETSGNTLAIGNNSIDGADVTYTYTASADETLTLSIGNAIGSTVTVTYSVNGAEAVALEANIPVNVALTAGDELVVDVVTDGGYATLAVSSDSEEEEVAEPDGTESNPYVLDSLPESITFESNTSDKVYYIFTATETGTLTFTWPTADSWVDIFEMDGTNTTANSDSVFSTETFSFAIEAGKTYRFSLGTWMNAGEVTVTITVA